MGLSVFDIIGPGMIGPSSSHTAGAVRLGLIAHALAEGRFSAAKIFFHGSFATTGRGHATDRGIVAGLLGFAPDDERLKDSIALAEKQGISLEFTTADLGEQAHPNTARIITRHPSREDIQITGASIGGGIIRIQEINRYETNFSGALDTLVIWHHDSPGFLAKITTLLSCVEANIATIQTARRARNTDALTVIEVDAPVRPDLISVMHQIKNVEHVVQIPRIA